MLGFIVFFVLAILGPLLMFTPRMAAAKRKGLADYAEVAQGYVDSFEEKWVLDTPVGRGPGIWRHSVSRGSEQQL
jgi:hypothetical protein